MARVVSGAEPWSAEGGPLGVLVLHGLTGSPAGVRPLAEALASEGLAIELPLLPGHGTHWRDLRQSTWHDWEREALAALERLRARTSVRIVAGLSMGGALALHLATTRPEDVDGLVLVNPWVATRDLRLLALPVLQHLVPGIAGVGNDIALPGADELAYPTLPLKALRSAIVFQRRLDLAAVRAPLLVFTSHEDHVVPPENSRLVLDGASSADTEQVWLEHSFHVATLDHDAPIIAGRALAFARRIGRKDHADA